jgi:predicted GNAT family N-acyltransferase
MKSFSSFLTEQAELGELKSKLDSLGVEHSITQGSDHITVHQIIVPKKNRGEGVGTQAMKHITDHADQHGKRVLLSPSKDFGGSSVDRLKKFYKGHGFVENKGRNKDYTISHTMYRNPR